MDEDLVDQAMNDLEQERREQEWPCKTCGHPRRQHLFNRAAPDLCVAVDDQLRVCRCGLYRRDWAAVPRS